MRAFSPTALAGGIGRPPSVGLPGGEGQTDLPDLIMTVIDWFLVLAGVLALAFLVYGGFVYITSAGDEKNVARGKQIMTYALIGLLAVGISYAVVEFVIRAIRQEGGG